MGFDMFIETHNIPEGYMSVSKHIKRVWKSCTFEAALEGDDNGLAKRYAVESIDDLWQYVPSTYCDVVDFREWHGSSGSTVTNHYVVEFKDPIATVDTILSGDISGKRVLNTSLAAVVYDVKRANVAVTRTSDSTVILPERNLIIRHLTSSWAEVEYNEKLAKTVTKKYDNRMNKAAKKQREENEKERVANRISGIRHALMDLFRYSVSIGGMVCTLEADKLLPDGLQVALRSHSIDELDKTSRKLMDIGIAEAIRKKFLRYGKYKSDYTARNSITNLEYAIKRLDDLKITCKEFKENYPGQKLWKLYKELVPAVKHVVKQWRARELRDKNEAA